MKPLLMLALLFICSNLFSQDVITLKNGDEIEGAVIEVGVSQIKYQKHGTVIHVIEKADVLSIRYKSGEREVFVKETPKKEEEEVVVEETSPVNMAPENIVKRAEQDAHIYYGGRNSGAIWTGVTVVGCGGIIGLAPALGTSLTTPKEVNLKMPKNFADNRIYKDAYTKESKKIKRNHVWIAYGIGMGINVLAFAALYAMSY